MPLKHILSQDVNAFLHKIDAQCSGSELSGVPIEVAIRRFEALSFTGIIGAVLDGKLRLISRDVNRGLKELRFRPVDLIKLARSSVEYGSDLLETSEAVSELGIVESAVLSLGKYNLLKLVDTGRRTYVARKSLIDFRRKFVSLCVLAADLKCDPITLLEHLENVGIRPVSIAGPQVILLFQKAHLRSSRACAAMEALRSTGWCEAPSSYNCRKWSTTIDQVARVLNISAEELEALYGVESDQKKTSPVSSTSAKSETYTDNRTITLAEAENLMKENTERFGAKWIRSRRIRHFKSAEVEKLPLSSFLTNILPLRGTLTSEEVKRVVSGSSDSVQNWRRMGFITAVSGRTVDGKRNYLYRVADVLTFVGQDV